MPTILAHSVIVAMACRSGEGGRGGDVSLDGGRGCGAGSGGGYGDEIGSLMVGSVIKVVVVVMVVVLVLVVAAVVLMVADSGGAGDDGRKRDSDGELCCGNNCGGGTVILQEGRWRTGHCGGDDVAFRVGVLSRDEGCWCW